MVLACLEVYEADSSYEPATKACALLNQFCEGTTVLGLKVAVLILSCQINAYSLKGPLSVARLQLQNALCTNCVMVR